MRGRNPRPQSPLAARSHEDATVTTTAITATIAPLCARYIAMLEDAGIPTPLQQELTVVAVLALELCALAAEPTPTSVLENLGPTTVG